MNASLGIVLQKIDRERLLTVLPPRLRTWGSEVFEEEGPSSYATSVLDGVVLRVVPVTKFILGRLPSSEQVRELEYIAMIGPAIDAYEEWARENHDASESNTLEVGLITLLEQVPFWALMFAPEGDRLGAFITVDANTAVQALRRGATDISASAGFLAINSSGRLSEGSIGL